MPLMGRGRLGSEEPAGRVRLTVRTLTTAKAVAGRVAATGKDLTERTGRSGIIRRSHRRTT
ncbi:hypothetical protein SCMC78_32380 [Streptomyces sp. CMC78]|uniref:Uncharacterized protein n=1 Tax=Streptomyces sp. CMC78 TaxID=3231512 RepID=A0AB33KFL0_9ACTN|nr:hypothetical protein GCM10010504_70320 [Streptomyces griseus]